MAGRRGSSDLLRRQESGESVDAAAFEKTALGAIERSSTARSPPGIDVINDGEQARPNFHDYVFERLTGFERRQKPAGAANPRANSREYIAFPEFYADKASGASLEGGTLDEGHCIGPITYRGQAAVRRRCPAPS